MFAELASWWVAQMRSLIPGLDDAAGRKPDALIIAIDQLEAQVDTETKFSGSVLIRHNGEESLIQNVSTGRAAAPAAAPQLPTGLRLPKGSVLSRNVLLPLTATRDLPTVMTYEMDRLTPFSSDEVYWSAGHIIPDRARGRISLQLSVVPRDLVETLRHPLLQAGFNPSFVEFEGGRIELNGKRPQWRHAQAIWPALCALALTACIVSPFIRQQFALNRAERAIASLQSQADTAQALRRQLAAAAAGQAAIAKARQDGDALQVLAALTTALPDDTWLSDLTLKSGDLTFDGQSTNAAQLIKLLSNAKGLHDPSFTAPVTRTADGKADIFAMHVSVGP